MLLVVGHYLVDDQLLFLHEFVVLGITGTHWNSGDLVERQLEIHFVAKELLGLLRDVRELLFEPPLVAAQVVVNNHLLLNVVQELVADPVGIIYAILNGRVPREEVLMHVDHHPHVLVLQEEALDVLAALVLCLAFL